MVRSAQRDASVELNIGMGLFKENGKGLKKGNICKTYCCFAKNNLLLIVITPIIQ